MASFIRPSLRSVFNTRSLAASYRTGGIRGVGGWMTRGPYRGAAVAGMGYVGYKSITDPDSTVGRWGRRAMFAGGIYLGYRNWGNMANWAHKNMGIRWMKQRMVSDSMQMSRDVANLNPRGWRR